MTVQKIEPVDTTITSQLTTKLNEVVEVVNQMLASYNALNEFLLREEKMVGTGVPISYCQRGDADGLVHTINTLADRVNALCGFVAKPARVEGVRLKANGVPVEAWCRDVKVKGGEAPGRCADFLCGHKQFPGDVFAGICSCGSRNFYVTVPGKCWDTLTDYSEIRTAAE
jgi:hypothetical protein